jgi:hypothetical protein
LFGLLKIADSGSFVGKVVLALLELVVSREQSLREDCFPSSTTLGIVERVWGIILEVIDPTTET